VGSQTLVNLNFRFFLSPLKSIEVSLFLLGKKFIPSFDKDILSLWPTSPLVGYFLLWVIFHVELPEVDIDEPQGFSTLGDSCLSTLMFPIWFEVASSCLG